MTIHTQYLLSGLLVSIIVVALMIKYVNWSGNMAAPFALALVALIITFIFGGIGKVIQDRQNK